MVESVDGKSDAKQKQVRVPVRTGIFLTVKFSADSLTVFVQPPCASTSACMQNTTNTDSYWTIQARLLTPLTFAQHRLSPLAVFTSGAYFLHNGRR